MRNNSFSLKKKCLRLIITSPSFFVEPVDRYSDETGSSYLFFRNLQIGYICMLIFKSLGKRKVKLLNKFPFPFSDAISLKVWKNESETSYECKYLPFHFFFQIQSLPLPLPSSLPMYIYIHVPVCGRGLAHFCRVW